MSDIKNTKKMKRFIFLGDKGVGKTTYINAFINKHTHRCLDDEINLVRSSYFLYKSIPVDIEMVEPSDDPIFFKYQKILTHDADIIFLCFDLYNVESFYSIEKYYKSIDTNPIYPHGIILLGMKAEQTMNYGRAEKVTKDMINDMVTKLKIDQYHTVSCFELFNLYNSMYNAVGLAIDLTDPFSSDQTFFKGLKRFLWRFGFLSFDYL